MLEFLILMSAELADIAREILSKSEMTKKSLNKEIIDAAAAPATRVEVGRGGGGGWGG